VPARTNRSQSALFAHESPLPAGDLRPLFRTHSACAPIADCIPPDQQAQRLLYDPPLDCTTMVMQGHPGRTALAKPKSAYICRRGLWGCSGDEIGAETLASERSGDLWVT
jgi:hypothetical protein